jgi:hypothetical protein
MFTVSSLLGRAARTLGVLALVAALFGAFALTSPASAAETVGTLTVHVATTTDTPIERAVVYAYNAQGVAVAKAETDAKGNAAFKLSTGLYKVFTKAAGYENNSTATKVAPGAVSAVKVTLQRSNSDRTLSSRPR